MLKQEGGRAPFDIQGYRYIEYNPFQFEAAQVSLENTIGKLIENDYVTDSAVFNSLGHYEVIRKRDRPTDIVPWSLVYATIDQISERLQAGKNGSLANNESYQPDIILGITNGGMVFAELLYRTLRDQKIYRQEDCIIHALWARRHPHPVFNNAANDGMLKGFIEGLDKGEADVRVLLLDDNSGSGDTASFARTYINDQYPRVHVRYLPLFYKVSAVYQKIESFIVWSYPAFELSRHEVDNIHYVEQAEFPYKKHIRDGVDLRKLKRSLNYNSLR